MRAPGGEGRVVRGWATRMESMRRRTPWQGGGRRVPPERRSAWARFSPALGLAGVARFLPPGAHKRYNQSMSEPTDKRKQSLYFPEEMLREIQDEANRQDRSLSWIVQQAWKVARGHIAKIPGVNEPAPPKP